MPSGSEKILFVDDEGSSVEVVQEMLQEMGYTVMATANVLEALALFNENPDRFDLVITDKNMPHMTGFDFGRELLRIKPDLPVILCTGSQDQDDIDKAKELGFRDVIKKPMLMRDMAETIRCVLDLRTRNDQTSSFSAGLFPSTASVHRFYFLPPCALLR